MARQDRFGGPARSRAQDLAIEGLIGPDELREKLARFAGTREAAEKELAALEGRRERLAELERDRDALVETYAALAPAALDALAPEERHHLYKLLRLRVVARPDGALDLSGVFSGGGGIGKSGPIRRSWR